MVYSVVSIVGLITPLESLSGGMSTSITIFGVAKTMAILFSLIYFSQMLFLVLLDKFKELTWYKYLLINIAVQGIQFLFTLPLSDNKTLAFHACIFRIVYIAVFYKVAEITCEIVKNKTKIHQTVVNMFRNS